METGDGDGKKKRKRTARRRRKPTGASPSPSLSPPPAVGMGPGDGAAPLPFLAPPPGPGDGGAPTERRSRKPDDAEKNRKGTPARTARRSRNSNGASPPPSLPPPPSVGMAPGDGTAPPPSLAPPPSGPGDGGAPTADDAAAPPSPPGPGDGGAPTATTRSEPDGDAAPPSLASPSFPRMGLGDGGARRKRAGSQLRRGGKKGKRIVPEGNSCREDSRICVAHTPNVPPRFEGLLKKITCLIPYYESKGKSYECTLSRMNAFLGWSKSKMGLFFEWSDDEKEAICWMHDIVKKKHFKFTVNAAFAHEMDIINVERAAVAFSTNFIGGDEYWSDLRDMLLDMFGSFEGEGSKVYDYLYVFTRVGSTVYFRNFKITSLPKADDPSSGLVLTEINTMFCLKLVNDQGDQGTPSSSNIGPHLPNDQTPTKLILCPVTLYSGQSGFCLSHEVDFSGQIYSVLLDNGSYISSLQELDGFNISLAEIVVLEPLLKIKHIIGSATNKTYCFARERCKSLVQSLFAEFAALLESGKCISKTGKLQLHNILVRGANVRLYGVELTDYSEDLAKHTVVQLVRMVERCFPTGTIPEDLHDLLNDLEKEPLDQIRIAKDDCSVMKAKDRWALLIKINSEFMTNVEAKSTEPDEIDNKINDESFFDNCPYAEDWKQIMKDNEYMVQLCNVCGSSEQGKGSNEDKNAAVVQRMKKREKRRKNTSSIRKCVEKKTKQINKRMLQFSSKINFHMHMPEKARKDGIFPFRLGMADYILTAYFPRYLRFVQKRMREFKAQRGKFKKRKRPSYVARGQAQ